MNDIETLRHMTIEHDMTPDEVYNVFMDDDTEWPMSRWCRPKYINW